MLRFVDVAVLDQIKLDVLGQLRRDRNIAFVVFSTLPVK
jgi:hypothetical protein